MKMRSRLSCRVLYMSYLGHSLHPFAPKQALRDINYPLASYTFGKLSARSVHTNRPLYNRNLLSQNEIRKDFFQWFKREAKILTVLAIAGIIGVYFYKDREQAPYRQVIHYINEAKKCAQQNNKKDALQYCVRAYQVTKATNSKDSHLFELAFSIAAQHETLESPSQAVIYYTAALSHTDYSNPISNRLKNKIVTLDRLAQCCQDQYRFEQANKYFLQAIQLYEQAEKQKSNMLEEVKVEIPAVYYNYGRYLIGEEKNELANTKLQRALTIAIENSLPHDDISRIQDLLHRKFEHEDSDKTST